MSIAIELLTLAHEAAQRADTIGCITVTHVGEMPFEDEVDGELAKQVKALSDVPTLDRRKALIGVAAYALFAAYSERAGKRYGGRDAGDEQEIPMKPIVRAMREGTTRMARALLIALTEEGWVPPGACEHARPMPQGDGS